MTPSQRPTKADSSAAKAAEEDAVSVVFEMAGICGEATIVSSGSPFSDGRFPPDWLTFRLGGRWLALRVS